MADKARWYNSKTHAYEEISVHDISLYNFSKNEKFKCINPLCNVDILLRNSSNGGFAFSTFPKQAMRHVDTFNCIRSSLVFVDSKYSEKKFSFYRFMNNLSNEKSLSPNGRAAVSKTDSKKILNDSRPAIRGLSTFYSMLCSKGKNDTYNGIRIGDMFCDSENFNEFITNPSGNKVLECSYFCPVYGEKAFYINFPIDNRISGGTLVKIVIEDTKYFFELKDTIFKKSRHIEPLVIAGNWIEDTNPSAKAIAYCNIYSKRQLAYLKND